MTVPDAGGAPYDVASTAWGITPASADPRYGHLIAALRDVQDAISAAAAPTDVVVAAAARLAEVAAMFTPYEVDEAHQVFGHRPDLHGRGQAMTPPVIVDEWDEQHVRGRVTIPRFYIGGGGAVHGGVPALVWDEVLGRLANTGRRTKSRTAYLHIDYRSVTPIGRELTFDGTFDREEGRKRFLSGRMYDGERLVTEAGGLFVALREGQP